MEIMKVEKPLVALDGVNYLVMEKYIEEDVVYYYLLSQEKEEVYFVYVDKTETGEEDWIFITDPEKKTDLAMKFESILLNQMKKEEN